MSEGSYRRALVPTGRFSPLRYPGGKGKIARFVAHIVRENALQDGTYVEPYAGGAGIAWELLLTGIVRRVELNDISLPIYAFWRAVLEETDELCRRINDTPVTAEVWDRAKKIFAAADGADTLDLAFATFFLNRTNRSGILNGGMIGGRDQTGPWKIDARFSRIELIDRIHRIAEAKGRISLFHLDAIDFLKKRSCDWRKNTLIYLDPPYFLKGGQLYYNSYSSEDHQLVATAVTSLSVPWIVSYDAAPQIERLYAGHAWLKYTIGYSARERIVGSEVMFFSPALRVPPVSGSMVEVGRAAEMASS